jgi:hypothetical protein
MLADIKYRKSQIILLDYCSKVLGLSCLIRKGSAACHTLGHTEQDPHPDVRGVPGNARMRGEGHGGVPAHLHHV